MSACKSDYTKYVHRELATGIANDSLIFDMYMGQTRKQFYDRCWDLNKQKVVHQGSGANVKLTLPPDEKHPERGGLLVYFYGAFDEEKIMRGMNFTYSYRGWSPWNENLGSDSLLVALKDILLRQYGGNPWLDVDLENITNKTSVKIDGNRQFLMYTMDERQVKVKISDLNHKLKN